MKRIKKILSNIQYIIRKFYHIISGSYNNSFKERLFCAILAFKSYVGFNKTNDGIIYYFHNLYMPKNTKFIGLNGDCLRFRIMKLYPDNLSEKQISLIFKAIKDFEENI